MFDIFTLTLFPPGNAISHLSPSGARPMQMPFLQFRPTSRTSPANSTLLPSSTRSSSIAMGAILALAVGLLSQDSPGGGNTRHPNCRESNPALSNLPIEATFLATSDTSTLMLAGTESHWLDHETSHQQFSCRVLQFADPGCPTALLFLCHLSRSLSQSPRYKQCSANHCRSSISLCPCSADSNLDLSLQLRTPNRHSHYRSIHSHNLPNRASTSHLANLPSSHSPNRATIHQASPPHRQQIPTNRQVRQAKNSQLEHVATQRIQGQKQQSVKDVTPLHQVPSDDGPAIEGTGPSCDPISNSDHNNLGTAHDARATNFPFLSHCCSFPYLSLLLSPCLSFPCLFLFLSPFLSLYSFLYRVPFHTTIHADQLQTLSHLILSQQY